MAELCQYCTFYLDGHYFGVEVLRVQEVIKAQEMANVPLSAHAVSGLINLRGEIVMALDLRRILGFDERKPEDLPTNVVIHAHNETIALLVDEIGDVLEVDEEDHENTPGTVESKVRALLEGVYKLEEGLLLILDVDKVVSAEMEPA